MWFTPRVTGWLRSLTLRTLALFAIAVVASIAFVVLAAQVRTGELDRLDVIISRAIYRFDSPLADIAMKTVTLIGSNVVLLPAVALVTLLAIHRRRRLAAIVLVLDAVVVVVADRLLKLMFARERPMLLDKVALPPDYSFPSGHAMSAVGIYGVIAAALIAFYPQWRRAVLVSATLLVAAIGFSRIYLGVHWTFDVVGGFLGGVPPLMVSVHLLHRRGVRDRNLADLIRTRAATG